MKSFSFLFVLSMLVSCSHDPFAHNSNLHQTSNAAGQAAQDAANAAAQPASMPMMFP